MNRRYFPRRPGRSATSFLNKPDESAHQAYLQEIALTNPDLLLVSDYIAGALSPEDEALLEARLEHDEELRVWALPLIRVRDVMRGADSTDDPLGHGLTDAELDAAGARAIARFNAAVEEELTGVRPAADGRPSSGKDSDGKTPVAPQRTNWIRRIFIYFVATAIVLTVLFLLAPAIELLHRALASKVGDRWVVQHSELANHKASLALPYDGDLSVDGPGVAALRKRSLFSLADWRDETEDLYASGAHIELTYRQRGERGATLSTPRMVVTLIAGKVIIDNEGACGSRVLSLGVGVVLSVPGGSSRAIDVPTGYVGQVRCDGTIQVAGADFQNGGAPMPTPVR